MTGDPVVVLARNIRARRKALKLTQEAAGDRARMDASYWGRIEHARLDPGVRMIVRVATALETTPAELLAGAASEPVPERLPMPYRVAEMTASDDDEEIVITIRRASATTSPPSDALARSNVGLAVRQGSKPSLCTHASEAGKS